MSDTIQEVATVAADAAKVETVVTTEVSAVKTEAAKVELSAEQKIAEATPIVQGWIRKLRDDGHALYEEVKTLEQELITKVEAFFGKKPGDVVIAVPTAVVTATDPNATTLPNTTTTTQ